MNNGLRKHGIQVYDADTHIQPSNEALDPYFDPAFRARLPELEQYAVTPRDDPTQTPRGVPGRHHYSIGRVSYRRVLGQADPPAEPVPNRGTFQGTKLPAVGVMDDAVDARIQDMDEEGVDVHLMVPQLPTGLSLLKDPSLEMGFIRAYHRYVNDYCGTHPHRLKALMVVTATAIEESVEEVRRWGASSWAVGVWPYTGMELPLDHPDLEPVWAAVAEKDLAVVDHSRSWDPPYFPGYRDLYDNLFLARLSSHPWGAMRSMAAFIGAGIMDRFPAIRFGVLESGCGWLPFWSRRMEDQAAYVGTTAELRHSIGEYVTGGRFFASIEMHEGEDMIRMVMDFLGEGVLMYASDYPHPECRFPGSPDHVMGWKSLGPDTQRALMWENAVRFYGEP